jgi:uncharacterized membrane protein
LTVTSWGNADIRDQSTLVTTSKLFGVALNTDSLSILGLPGEEVVYELQVTNTSNYTDTFTVQITSTWLAMAEPVWIGPLPAHGFTTLKVFVRIPIDADKGSSSDTIVVVNSRADISKQAVANLTTYVAWYQLFLPVVQK